MTYTLETISPNITLIETYDDIQNFYTWLSKSRPVLAFDTETEGLSFISDKVRLVQFGDAQAAWAMSWENWRGVALDVFNNYEGDMVGHNVKFDINFIESSTGIRLPRARIHDTMIMSRLANWDVPNHQLKNLIGLHVDPRLTAGQSILDDAMHKNKWSWKTVPIDYEGYWFYGGLDCVLTAILYDMYNKKIDDEGFRDNYELEMQMLSIAADMEQKGVRVDLDYCERKYEELNDYAVKAKDYCQETYGVSPGSSPQITKILVADGVPLDKRTPGGALSFDAETIERFKDQHPLCETVFKYKKAVKLANTYFKNFLEENRNGRIHCSINTLQAITGRMSVTHPALQTLPRGRTVRDAFIPEVDEKWCSIDFSNIELRIGASFAQEQTMIDLFKQGEDLHGYLAKQIFETQEITKEQRQVAKNANFAKIYQAGARKFALTGGITLDLAEKVYAGYDKTFPEMKVYAKKVMEEGRKNYARDGYCWVRSPSGRRHVVKADNEYKFINYLVQSEAAEVLKKALVRLTSAGFAKYMLLPVHDEVLFSFPEDTGLDLQREAVELMQDLTSYDVPLVVEASPLETSWGAAK